METLPAFLETFSEKCCVARVPSTDGEREYVVSIVHVPDNEAEGVKGRYEGTCRCKGWRLGPKTGHPGNDWCKHLFSAFSEWAIQRSLARRG